MADSTPVADCASDGRSIATILTIVARRESRHTELRRQGQTSGVPILSRWLPMGADARPLRRESSAAMNRTQSHFKCAKKTSRIRANLETNLRY
jgi:hypothetical protein